MTLDLGLVRILRWCGAVMLSLCCCVSGLAGDDAGKGEDGEKAPVGRTPLVVLKQAAIEGQVFWIADEDGKQMPAEDVEVVVRSWDTDAKLFATVTDKDGKYALPNLDLGKYHFFVGRLKLELNVTEAEKKGERIRRISKKIIIFIPEEMQ